MSIATSEPDILGSSSDCNSYQAPSRRTTREAAYSKLFEYNLFAYQFLAFLILENPQKPLAEILSEIVSIVQLGIHRE